MSSEKPEKGEGPREMSFEGGVSQKNTWKRDSQDRKAGTKPRGD